MKKLSAMLVAFILVAATAFTAFANFSAGGRGVFKLFRRRGALNKHKRLAFRAYAVRKRRFDI